MNDQTDTRTLPGKWLLFEPTDSRAYIEARFTARFNVLPETVQSTGGGQLAGPIPERHEQLTLEM